MAYDEGMTKPENSAGGKESFWLANEAAHIREEPDTKPAYDLEERTARFGEAIIDFAKKVPVGPLTRRIINQLVGAGTSVGANYDEADDAVSKKEFLKCIGTCKKEARESKHFLRMAACAVPELKSEARELWLEAQGIALNLREDLEERKREMTKREPRIFRHSPFVLSSSFVIRHSSF
jgi:four helix bundle protein